VLSSQERRIWQEVERRDTAGTGDLAPPALRRREHGVDDLPVAVVAGIWTSTLLVLVGLVLAGLAVGALTTVLALVWRYRPPRRG
jgi:hypothetical protein